MLIIWLSVVTRILQAEYVEQLLPHADGARPNLGATNGELVAALGGGDYVLLRRQAAMELRVVALQAPRYLQRIAPALLVPQLDLLPVGRAARYPVLVVDAHVAHVGTQAANALQPVRTVHTGVCVDKYRHIREVVVEVNYVFEVRPGLSPAVEPKVVGLGRVQLLVQEHRISILLHDCGINCPGRCVAVFPLTVDSRHEHFGECARQEQQLQQKQPPQKQPPRSQYSLRVPPHAFESHNCSTISIDDIA
mmetsp:Transcript_29605/g.65634  ORF Transcript_29605/g.65634 Transcript_29605/m.65634 type:complete len:250 (-) Transcript_29605:100-849(-)